MTKSSKKSFCRYEENNIVAFSVARGQKNNYDIHTKIRLEKCSSMPASIRSLNESMKHVKENKRPINKDMINIIHL